MPAAHATRAAHSGAVAAALKAGVGGVGAAAALGAAI